MHRVHGTGVRHYLRSEYGNWILKTIRNRLTDGIIYQSKFACSWWHRKYGPSGRPETVVHNAVDLVRYAPMISEEPPDRHYRLLVIEGSLAGGYDSGLASAVGLAQGLTGHPGLDKKRPIELMIVGRASEEVRAKWADSGVNLIWQGVIPPDQIPSIDRQAHLLFSSDINAACPNAVIEALACGTPVLAFDTGALPELVTSAAGQVVSYGGDPWKLDPPVVGNLIDGAVRILSDQPSFRHAARQLAQNNYGLDDMVDNYLNFLTG